MTNAQLQRRLSAACDAYEAIWGELPPTLVLLHSPKPIAEIIDFIEDHVRERRRIRIEPGTNGIPTEADL